MRREAAVLYMYITFIDYGHCLVIQGQNNQVYSLTQAALSPLYSFEKQNAFASNVTFTLVCFR